MECIHCGRISRRAERPDGRCPECGHAFALDPEVRSVGTDAEFKAAIDRVSDGGRLRFTTRQLWLAANGKSRLPPPSGSGESAAFLMALALTLPVAFIVLVSGMFEFLFLAIPTVAAGMAMGRAGAKDEQIRYADRLRLVPFEPFQQFKLSPWLTVHGSIPGLLPPREEDPAAAPPRVPADAAAFRFDRAVVTDRWETAQMLLANGFHTEHGCAVLSRDGYPNGTAQAVRQALRRAPRLTVFALHDASPEGCMLPVELRGPEWFPDPSVRIVDLGLRPETVRRLQVPYLPGRALPALPEPLYELLVYPDREWLVAGNTFELAAVASAQVLRAAFEGMAAAGPHDGSGGTPAYNDAPWTGVGVSAAPAAPDGADTTADLAAVSRRMSGVADY